MDRPIAVQSPSGMIYPPSVIKKKAPERVYGPLELMNESDREKAKEAFFTLRNLGSFRQLGGIVFPDPGPKANKILEDMLMTLAHAMLGEDWEPEILC